MNYGRGVGGNAALNTVVMCLDLRKRSAGQGLSGPCAGLLGNPVGDAVGHGHECSRVRTRAPSGVGSASPCARAGVRSVASVTRSTGDPHRARRARLRRGERGAPALAVSGAGAGGPSSSPAVRCGPGRPLGSSPGRPRTSIRTLCWSEVGGPPLASIAARLVRVQGGHFPRRRARPEGAARTGWSHTGGDARYAPQYPFWVGGLWAGPAIPDDDRGRGAGETTTIQPPNGR